MILKEKTKRRLRIVIASTFVICLGPAFERVRTVSGASNMDAFAGRDIVCAIELDDKLYGYQTGFNYEIVEEFARENRCGVKIITSSGNTNYIDSLKQGKVDIVIREYSDSTAANDDIMLSRIIGENTVWALPGNNACGLRQVNSWICHYTGTEDFEKLKNRFNRTSDPYRRAQKGLKTKALSPYDSLIKKYSATLGWDWRMLAAVIYQESKFSMNMKSPRGATGLMQVMPQTGRYYGVDNLTDPEQNIKAGVAHLKRLQDMMRRSGIEGSELVNFTLAAYNAGEGRIADCRSLAQAKNADSSRWDEVVKLIPLMREDAILEEESVKLGKFKGYETIEYVDNIMSVYQAFSSICN